MLQVRFLKLKFWHDVYTDDRGIIGITLLEFIRVAISSDSHLLGNCHISYAVLQILYFRSQAKDDLSSGSCGSHGAS